MKNIGIVTFHSSHNYGSVFQAYAMAKVMQNLGLNAKIIDFRHPATVAKFEFVWWYKGQSLKANLSNLLYRGLLGQGKKREHMFNEFIEKNMPLTKRYQNRKCINEHFDYLVCGSDQIWNPKATGKNDPIYYLDFDDDSTIRFSYAASSGSSPFAEGCEEQMNHYLKRMKGIGVRETYMKDYIQEKFGLSAVVNPDPTFLLDKEEWQKLEEPVCGLPKDYLLVYTLKAKQDCLLFAAEIGKKLNLPVVIINPGRGRKDRSIEGANYSLFDVAPGQWLWLYHNAKFVVSNTFHGNMFSVIYRKNFVCYAPDLRDTRIVTLHSRIGLGDTRLLKASIDFDVKKRTIDYGSINSQIESFRQEGVGYIRNQIK